jgi:hypothetical protein
MANVEVRQLLNLYRANKFAPTAFNFNYFCLNLMAVTQRVERENLEVPKLGN